MRVKCEKVTRVEMGKLSEMVAIGEVTPDDLFLVTDDTTGKSRRVKWSDIEASIVLANIPGYGSGIDISSLPTLP